MFFLPLSAAAQSSGAEQQSVPQAVPLPEAPAAAAVSRMDRLAADVQAFIDETEEQHTAVPVFRAKLRAALKRALEPCPPDFNGLVADLHSLAEEVASATVALPQLRAEQARAAQLYAAADNRGDIQSAKELLATLNELTARLMWADDAASSVHPLRLQYFRSLYGDYYGKTCPKNSVLLDGTFCFDIYESPDKQGVTPTIGLSYAEAESACKKAGKRLCSGPEWIRACQGPVCRPNQLVMKPFNVENCNPSLDIRSDRPVKPAGSSKSCTTPEGIADLYGNAWEWTDEDYKEYYKVLRGGTGYRELSPSCNATAWGMPDTQLSYSGARCCSDPAISWLPESDIQAPASMPPGPLPASDAPNISPPQPQPEEPPIPVPIPNLQPSPGFQ
ncbi:MAG: SUMF1/EgtB/PvdO family nonheme iron enzyme [bacterium]